MPENPTGKGRWLKGLAAAGRAFAVVMGGGGLGLLGGLCHGAWAASRVPPSGEFFALLTWVVSLAFSGLTGFVLGLAGGLLVMVMIWIVGLAKRIVRKWEASRGTPT